jgi:hypothetical protein
MKHDLDDEDFNVDIEESFYNEVEQEGLFHRSFKQAFGFWMGSFFALVFLSIIISLAAYIAVESGYITWEELLFIE